MSRFSVWVLEDSDLCTEYLERIVVTFLTRMLDPFKCVRATAISGLAYLAKRAGFLLAPWIEAIVAQMVSCLKVYQKKNRLILYDLFDRLAGSLPDEISTPKVAQAFVPLLLLQWQNLANDDVELTLLMQAMSTLTSVMGLAFQNCAKALAARCFILWETALVAEKVSSLCVCVCVFFFFFFFFFFFSFVPRCLHVCFTLHVLRSIASSAVNLYSKVIDHFWFSFFVFSMCR
jgi:hypothetical protein